MTFPVHTRETAPEDSRAAFDAAKKAYGFVPNLIGTLAEAPAAVNGYLGVADAFAASSLSSLEQQVVLLATSVTNECHYCVAAHSTVAGMVGGKPDLIEALRNGTPLPDPKLEALRKFTSAVVTRRGWVTEADLAAFKAAGYNRAQVLEVITGVAQKTISNYTNHIAATPLDTVFQPNAWRQEAAA